MAEEVNKKRAILLIEDDENDVFALRRALAHCHFDGEVRVVQSSWQARDYIEGRRPYHDRDYYPLPDLIISDFHLPGAVGTEFVHWLREQPRFRRLPVVIWTGSLGCNELERMLAAGASGHHLKTADFRTLCERVDKMLELLPKPF